MRVFIYIRMILFILMIAGAESSGIHSVEMFLFRRSGEKSVLPYWKEIVHRESVLSFQHGDCGESTDEHLVEFRAKEKRIRLAEYA